MRINSVDFPDSLFKAQKDGSLVVFAGAGVSIPPPSNFPDFNSLAEQVAAGVLSKEKDEPVDRFLGRLKDKGVAIHEKVRRILSDRNSKPNALHVDLLRLFEEPHKLRLVTTNFDLHFTSAGVERFPTLDSFEIYSAPALPLVAQLRRLRPGEPGAGQDRRGAKVAGGADEGRPDPGNFILWHCLFAW